jgi:hypothetical protein
MKMKKLLLILITAATALNAKVKTIDNEKGYQQITFESESGTQVDMGALRKKGYTLQFRFNDELVSLKEINNEDIVISRRIGQEHQGTSVTLVARKGELKVDFTQKLWGLSVDSVNKHWGKPKQVLSHYEEVFKWEKESVSASDIPTKVCYSRSSSLNNAKRNALALCLKKLYRITGKSDWKLDSFTQTGVEWQTLYGKTSCGRITKIASSPSVSVQAHFKRKYTVKKPVYKTVTEDEKKFW